MNEVVTIRPSNISIAPLFQSSVSEHPTNIFKMKVTSQSADARRMSFVFRSPGNKLLLSPAAYIQFQLKVTVPHNYCRAVNIAPVDARQNVAPNNGTFLGSNVVTNQQAQGPAISFGEGNAVMSAVESIQYTVNGGSVSHSNWNLFKRTLDSCYIPSRVAQRCFSQCGGSYNRYDATGVSAEQAIGRGGGAHAKAPASISIAGMTMDSGLQCRLRNFSDNVVASEAPTNLAVAQGVKLTVRVQARLDGCLFNQVYGEAGLSRSSPYQKQCLAIPNYNAGSLTILFKDLEKRLVRRLGRTYTGGPGSNLGAGGYADNAQFKVEYDSSYQATLHLEWLRLQFFRNYPDAVSLMTYRTQSYIQEMGPVSAGAIVASDTYSPDNPSGRYLLPSGPDFIACPESPSYLVSDANRFWDCTWQNLQFAQPPSYLFITAEKQSECLSFGEPAQFTTLNLTGAGNASAATAAGQTTAALTITALNFNRNIAQNQDSNLAIVRVKILIQSSVGTWEHTSDNYPWKQDQQEMFNVHKRNCCQSYLEDSGMQSWQNRCCGLLLSSSEYMQGLGTSPGTAFPIQVTVEAKFMNKCSFLDGIKYSDHRASGAIVHRDYIQARAVVVGIYDKQVLQISSSSSVLSAQNFTQSTTASLLSGRS